MRKQKEKYVGSRPARMFGNLIAILAIVLGIMAFTAYKEHAINSYVTAYRSKVFVCLGVGIALSFISILLSWSSSKNSNLIVKVVRAIAYLAFLYAILQYLYTQVNYIGALLMAIDVEQYEPLIPAFVETLGTMILAMFVSLFATCLNFRVKKKETKQKGRKK